ncbi:MAG: helix-turn-helix transcriptional regulator [Oscillospiraceae bacterium]|nr:helix-turn-helix transcriptional regulator [Oscillospiraceae bacterium]
MSKEEYVKHLIKSAGYSVKSFAAFIHIPYTTLLGMLKNGLGGAAVNNVMKVCRGLGITVENLIGFDGDAQGLAEPFYVNQHERLVIAQYRSLSEMRLAVDTILGIAKVSHDEGGSMG